MLDFDEPEGMPSDEGEPIDDGITAAEPEVDEDEPEAASDESDLSGAEEEEE